MPKNFDRWNGQKKRTNQRLIAADFFFHEREVWWCALGANIGVEADGKNEHFERPVLILKKFNKEMFWAVPLTSKPKPDLFHCEVSHEDGRSWASVTQLKTLSTKRLLRRVGMVSTEDFEHVQKQIASIIAPL